jgi:DNA polymerase-3 subunit alpha
MRERLDAEKELLGFYITGHPIDEYEADLRGFRTVELANIPEMKHEQGVRIAGIITAKEVMVSKKTGKPFSRVQIEDRVGGMEVMFFAESYEKYGNELMVGEPIVISGVIDAREEEQQVKVIAREAHTLEQACQTMVKEVYVRCPREKCGAELWRDLKEVATANHGEKPLCLVIPGPEGGLAMLETSADFSLTPSLPLFKDLRGRFGRDEVRIRARELPDMQRRKTWGNRG